MSGADTVTIYNNRAIFLSSLHAQAANLFLQLADMSLLRIIGDVVGDGPDTPAPMGKNRRSWLHWLPDMNNLI